MPTLSITNIIRLVVVALVIGLVGWAIYSISDSAKTKGTVKIIEQQGVANDEENSRALDALHTGSGIIAESDSDFAKRMLGYWASEGSGSTDYSESVLNIEYIERTYPPDGQFSGAEREAIELLQTISILPKTNSNILQGEMNHD